MRGKPHPRPVCPRVPGITPACAGKTCCGLCPSLWYGDHPRVCGENITTPALHAASAGSPPRVRGKLATLACGYQGGGITPACAGKTARKRRRATCGRDHPRVCGENSTRSSRAVKTVGSPPRVRGKQLVCFLGLKRSGITPACAGKTQKGVRAASERRDHPRVCGENFCRTTALAMAKGSPPRVRGKPVI